MITLVIFRALQCAAFVLLPTVMRTIVGRNTKTVRRSWNGNIRSWEQRQCNGCGCLLDGHSHIILLRCPVLHSDHRSCEKPRSWKLFGNRITINLSELPSVIGGGFGDFDSTLDNSSQRSAARGLVTNQLVTAKPHPTFSTRHGPTQYYSEPEVGNSTAFHRRHRQTGHFDHVLMPETHFRGDARLYSRYAGYFAPA